jgi:hypothetical protein
MATIKTFTSLEQSRKLAEILPLESADMYYYIFDDGSHYPIPSFSKPCGDDLPCWSLAALLDTLKDFNPDIMFLRSTTDCHGARLDNVWRLSVNIYTDDYAYLEIIIKDNPLDAVFEMILKLHEQKLL